MGLPARRGELIKVLFKDGQLIKAGDPLFEIDPRPYQTFLDAAMAQKAAADAAFKLAGAELDRTTMLIRSNASTREELDVRRAHARYDSRRSTQGRCGDSQGQAGPRFLQDRRAASAAVSAGRWSRKATSSTSAAARHC